MHIHFKSYINISLTIIILHDIDEPLILSITETEAITVDIKRK